VASRGFPHRIDGSDLTAPDPSGLDYACVGGRLEAQTGSACVDGGANPWPAGRSHYGRPPVEGLMVANH